MEQSFWLDRWGENRIGWHQNDINPQLVNIFDRLNLPEGARVFVPLCGKTLDIGWLLSKGYRVAGAELSELAIEQLFEGLGVAPEVSQSGPLKLYSAPDLEIYVGDIFELTAETLGPVDAVFDRAALVALPPEMRVQYTKHLPAITNTAPQLLLCFEYDQSVIDGPPFSIVPDEVRKHYEATYTLTKINSLDLKGGVRGTPAKDTAWLLT